MDSRLVEVEGMIENHLVRLAKYPDIQITMDILVIDVPDEWGMLLSRKWGATLGGSIQMDWTYATVPASEFSLVKLYFGKEKRYHVENPQRPLNEYVYNTDEHGTYQINSTFLDPIHEEIKDEKVDELWRMNFDGAYSRAGKGVAVVITSPKVRIFNFAFRLEFKATNNVAEYEALLVGIELAKDMGIKLLSIKGDSDLIDQQIKGQFECKCQRLKKYRNSIWDTMEFFYALNIEEIPRDQNSAADKLAVSASTLQPSEAMLEGSHPLEINFRPFVPDNVEHWQVFKDDEQILRFINNIDEFSNFKANEQEQDK